MPDWFSRRPAGFIPRPGVLPRVNWRHPLAQGLAACYLPGLSPFDLAGRGPALLSRQSWVPSVTPFGMAGTGGTSSSDASAWGALPPGLQFTSAVSLYFLGQQISDQADSDYFGATYNNAPSAAWSSPYAAWFLRDTSGGTGQFQWSWNNNGTLEAVGSTEPSQPAAGAKISVLGTVLMGGTAYLYSNGALLTSTSAGTGPITYGSTPYFFVGASNSGDLAANRSILCAVWSRQLSAAEAVALNADPFGFLEWPEHRYPLRIGAAVNVTVTIDRFPPIENLATVISPGIAPDYLDTGDGSYLDTGDGSYLDTGLNPAGGNAPWEFGSGIRDDWPAIAESLATDQRDIEAPLEAQAGQGGGVGANAYPPFEFGITACSGQLPHIELGGAQLIDYVLVLESGAAVSGPLGDWSEDFDSDFGPFPGGIPLESMSGQATAATDQFLPIEVGALMRADANAAAEAGLTARADPAMPAESGGRVSLDAMPPTESGLTARMDAEAPFEYLGVPSILILSVDWFEWLATQRADGMSAEWAAVFRTDMQAPAESGVSVAADKPTALESAAAYRADTAGIVESGASQAIDRIAVLEALASAVRDGALIESLGASRVDLQAQAESAGTVRVDPGVPVEAPTGVTARADESMSIEALLVARCDPGVPIELLGTAAYFTGPSTVGVIEWAAQFGSAQLTMAEWSALSASDRHTILEWLRGQAADLGAQVEFGQTNPPPLFLVRRGRLRGLHETGRIRGHGRQPAPPGTAPRNFSSDFSKDFN
jgi:hypothetical protein